MVHTFAKLFNTRLRNELHATAMIYILVSADRLKNTGVGSLVGRVDDRQTFESDAFSSVL